MQITSGMLGTAAAIQREQLRFDRRAEAVVTDATALSDPAPGAGDAGSLAADLVGMRTEAVINSILYGVFRRQSRTDASVIDL